jgi:hypothetical protein
MQSRNGRSRVPKIFSDSDLARAKPPESQPICTVCGETLAVRKGPILDHSELDDLEMPPDPPLSPRRSLSPAMRWPR